MDIFEKAKELGEAIASSKEMDEYKKIEASLASDEKAKSLMNDYKLLQIEVVKASKEGRDKDVIEAIKNNLLDKQKEINEYKVTADFLVAKSNLDSLMKRVNDVIIYSISGEEPCSPNKCRSCSGCK